MDSQNPYGQFRSLAAPTPFSAAFPSSEETASHPDWLRGFTILRRQGRRQLHRTVNPQRSEFKSLLLTKGCKSKTALQNLLQDYYMVLLAVTGAETNVTGR